MPNMPAKDNDPFKGIKTGGWTKYGGERYGLKKEAIEDTWFCQACGMELPKELPPFLFEIYPQEYIRVCNICENLINRVGVRNNSTITFRRVTVLRRKRD